MKNLIFTLLAAGMALQTGVQAQNLNWVAGSASGLPTNAIISGQEGDLKLAVCRSSYNDGVHPGKVVAGKCNFGWGGAEISASTYEVLTGDVSQLSWVATGYGSPQVANAVTGGNVGTTQLMVCRGAFGTGVHPGKLFAEKCNIGYGGKEFALTSYEVLTVKPAAQTSLHWFLSMWQVLAPIDRTNLINLMLYDDSGRAIGSTVSGSYSISVQTLRAKADALMVTKQGILTDAEKQDFQTAFSTFQTNAQTVETKIPGTMAGIEKRYDAWTAKLPAGTPYQSNLFTGRTPMGPSFTRPN